MKTELSRTDITPKLIQSVTELLARMTIADVIGPQVVEVQIQCLSEIEIWSKPYPSRDIKSERILDPSDDYTALDDPNFKNYLALVDSRLREENLKPADMIADHCPKLVAEHNQIKAEWVVLAETGKMLEIDTSGIYGKNRQKLLDLTIGLVLSLDSSD